MNNTNPERNGAFVILEDEKETILLVRHAYGAKKWSLPGGGIGLGEISSKAAVRELYEETGYIATMAILTLIAILAPQLRYGMDLVFLCTKKAGQLRQEQNIDPQEISEIKCMSRDEIRALGEDIYPAQLRMIEDHYQSYKVSGKVVFAQL